MTSTPLRRRAAGPLLWLALITPACCSSDPELLRSPDPDARREALACLAAEADDEPDLRETLLTAAADKLVPDEEPDASVRAAAARVIRLFRGDALLPLLVERLLGDGGLPPDPSPIVRQEAAAGLGTMGGDMAAAALRAALATDPSPEVRLAAARELAHLGDRGDATAAALVAALSDRAASVRLNARRSLRELHEIDLGLDPRPWERWLDGVRRAREEEEEARRAAEEPLEEPFEPPFQPYDEPAVEEPVPGPTEGGEQ